MKKYVDRTIVDLWKISYPIMGTMLSLVLMLFVDRLFLAMYSQKALGAATSSGTICWAISGTFYWFAFAAEPFVAQYHGAKRFQELSSPVWQMLWFSLSSLIVFIPLSIWGGDLLFPSSSIKLLQKKYFSIMMYFGPIVTAIASLSSFFNGQGKTIVVVKIAVITNILNIILDPIMIFGVKGIFPSMGIEGAAIATCIAHFIQLIILMFLFLKRNNKIERDTYNWKLNIPLFKRCMRIGFPQAVSHVVEISGWALYYTLLVTVSESHITIAAICLNFFTLFSFLPEGLGKGVTITAGNYIGAKNYHLAKKSLWAGIKIFFVVFLILCIVIFSCPEVFIDRFLNKNTIEYANQLLSAKISLIIFLFFYFGEGIRSILSGLFVAAGDTLFLMWIVPISLWICFLLPIYFFVIKTKAGIETANFIAVLYIILMCLVYIWRYSTQKWRQIDLLSLKKESSTILHKE